MYLYILSHQDYEPFEPKQNYFGHSYILYYNVQDFGKYLQK